MRSINGKSSILLATIVAAFATMNFVACGPLGDPLPERTGGDAGTGTSTTTDTSTKTDAGMGTNQPMACMTDDDCRGDDEMSRAVCLMQTGQCIWDGACKSDEDCGGAQCLPSGLCAGTPGQAGMRGETGPAGQNGMNGQPCDVSTVTRSGMNGTETCLIKTCPGQQPVEMECIPHPAACMTTTASVAGRTGCYNLQCPGEPVRGPFCDGADGEDANCQFTSVDGTDRMCVFVQCARDLNARQVGCVPVPAGCTVTTPYTRTSTSGSQTCVDMTCPPNPMQNLCVAAGTNCTTTQDGACIVMNCDDGTTSRACPPTSNMATCTSTQTSVTTGNTRRDCLVETCDDGTTVTTTDLFCVETDITTPPTGCTRGTVDCQCLPNGTCSSANLVCEERYLGTDPATGGVMSESRCVLPSGCVQGDLGCRCNPNGSCNYQNLECVNRGGFGWYSCELRSGPMPDAGPSIDSGVPLDGGVTPPDGGVMPDAGMPDGGVTPPDGGVAPDASMPDGGVTPTDAGPSTMIVNATVVWTATTAEMAQISSMTQQLHLMYYTTTGETWDSYASGPRDTMILSSNVELTFVCGTGASIQLTVAANVGEVNNLLPVSPTNRPFAYLYGLQSGQVRAIGRFEVQAPGVLPVSGVITTNGVGGYNSVATITVPPPC